MNTSSCSQMLDTSSNTNPSRWLPHIATSHTLAVVCYQCAAYFPIVSEPDPSHGEEEGSGHMPTFDGMQLCVGN